MQPVVNGLAHYSTPLHTRIVPPFRSDHRRAFPTDTKVASTSGRTADELLRQAVQATAWSRERLETTWGGSDRARRQDGEISQVGAFDRFA